MCQLLFFFISLRHPSTTTLFPYTTLFRSSHLRNETHGDVRGTTGTDRPGRPARPRRPRRNDRRPNRGPRGLVRLVGAPRPRRPDRKSTRLNSSHANISYAVFCLKKKKTYT